MKYCGYCGTELNEEYTFCTNCGKQMLEENQTEVYNNQTNDYCYQQKSTTGSLKYSIIGFVFSLVSITFAVYYITPIFCFASLPIYIVFTVLSKSKARKHLKKGNTKNGFVKAARVISTVAIPVGIVFFLIGIGFTLVALGIE